MRLKAGTIFVAKEGSHEDRRVAGVFRAKKDFDLAVAMLSQGWEPSRSGEVVAARGQAITGVADDGSYVIGASRREAAATRRYSPEKFLEHLVDNDFVEELLTPIVDLGDFDDPMCFSSNEMLLLAEQWVRACMHGHEDCLRHPELSAACAARDSETWEKAVREAGATRVAVSEAVPEGARWPDFVRVGAVFEPSARMRGARSGLNAVGGVAGIGERVTVVGFRSVVGGLGFAVCEDEGGRTFHFAPWQFAGLVPGRDPPDLRLVT